MPMVKDSWIVSGPRCQKQRNTGIWPSWSSKNQSGSVLWFDIHQEEIPPPVLTQVWLLGGRGLGTPLLWAPPLTMWLSNLRSHLQLFGSALSKAFLGGEMPCDLEWPGPQLQWTSKSCYKPLSEESWPQLEGMSSSINTLVPRDCFKWAWLPMRPCAYIPKSLQSCLTLCDPKDCSSPGSSVHGILQARILEWIAMPSSRGSSRPRDWGRASYVSCIDRQVLYH